MAYIDGFLVPVPVKNLKAYQAMSRRMGKIWREHGALDYRECRGDDLEVKGVASFRKAASARKGETVVFAYIVYKSRRHRDQVNRKVMSDPRVKHAPGQKHEMPFDFKRMCYGGFEVFVKA